MKIHLEALGEVVVVGHRSQGIDALNFESLIAATSGYERLLVTIGLAYDTKVRQCDWQLIVNNVITAAKVNNRKLVFFDNVYLYGQLNQPFDEAHPRLSISKKGHIRLGLIDQLEKAMSEGVDVLIVRSADFYGGADSSTMDMILSGKVKMFFENPDRLHSYAYVSDTAKAVVYLAVANDTYNQTWHLPTDTAITSREMLDLLSNPPKIMVVDKPLLNILSLFIPIVRELKEIMYQFDHDYVMDSSKFRKRFPSFKVTTYQEVLKILSL